MKELISFYLIIAFGLPIPALNAKDARLHFKENGFSIVPLEGKTDTAIYQSLMMFLPPSEGFAPNVNVQVQPYEGSMKEYVNLSKHQFKTAKLTVLNETITEKSVVFEYSGLFQDRELHWYAKAELKEGKIYLVTATAIESQWKTVATKLKTCVNSFKLDEGDQGSPP